jgi:hypothetical protein
VCKPSRPLALLEMDWQTDSSNWRFSRPLALFRKALEMDWQQMQVSNAWRYFFSIILSIVYCLLSCLVLSYTRHWLGERSPLGRALLFISSKLSRCARRALRCSPRSSTRAKGIARREITGSHTQMMRLMANKYIIRAATGLASTP